MVGFPRTPRDTPKLDVKKQPSNNRPQKPPRYQKSAEIDPKSPPDALQSDFFYFFENLDFVQLFNGFAMFLPSRGVAGATFFTKKRVLELGCAFDTSEIIFFRLVCRKCFKIARPGMIISPG